MEYRKLLLRRAVWSTNEFAQHLNGHIVRMARAQLSAAPFDEDGGPAADDREEDGMGIIRAEEQTYHFLQLLVDSWMAAQCNYTQWARSNPEFLDRINNAIKEFTLELTGSGGTAKVVLRKPIAGWDPNFHADQQAAKLFLDFITSPLYDRIGQCRRCSRYFVNVTGYWKKVYCSGKCATRHTALISMRARRRMERSEKLKKCRRGLEAYARLKKAPKNWKDYVSKKAGVTPKFITRAVNNGELPQPPSKKGK